MIKVTEAERHTLNKALTILAQKRLESEQSTEIWGADYMYICKAQGRLRTVCNNLENEK